MLPCSDIPPVAYSKPKNPDSLDCKVHYSSHLSLHHRRTWFFLSVFLLQLLLLRLLSAPSRPPSTTLISDVCPYGKVYVYKLPPQLNTDVLTNCELISPLRSRCDDVSNFGFGKSAAKGLSRILPRNLSAQWFWTNQFSLELIYHNRMLNYPCRTLEPESAAAFYIPAYLGLAVEKYLFEIHGSVEDRDRHCTMMFNWLHDQPFFNKSNGLDHLTTLGRISGDFRRIKEKQEDWGSNCINRPEARNVTRFLIEKKYWDQFDIAVPYPSGFHPSSVADVRAWQDYVRSRVRRTLFCFAGGRRAIIQNDFRQVLMNQCISERGSCRVVNCEGSKCEGGSAAILGGFLGSKFCLQPRGDSMTRRSIFDCMVAGSIPVFFWHKTVHLQYEWFLPDEPGSYSVFIDRRAVRNGTSIKDVLEKISKEEVRKMRKKVIEYIPKLVYANSNKLEGMRDAFDVAVEGFLRRLKEERGNERK
ncbi:hypothetical protein ACS0TY_004435 [Phlomoides rotata]